MLNYFVILLSWIDGVPGRPGKSQKEGQEDHGGVKELGGTPKAFRIPLSSWPSFGLFPGLPGTYLTLNGPSSDRAMLSYLAIFLKLD
jgi:hypothetical protein